MNLAVIGTGKIVKDFFQFIDEVENINLIAICSTERSKEKMLSLAEQHNIPYRFTDYNQLMQCEEVDAVYVAVPNHLHFPVCLSALNAGKHVICEKPFTSNLKELQQLKTVAEENKLILMEAITTQYIPNMKKIKELLESLGNVKVAVGNFSHYSSQYDNFKNGIIMNAFDCHKSGGALMDINVYNIHFFVGLFGKPEKVHYQANMKRNIDVSGVLTMDYGDMQVVCIGAKDCKQTSDSFLQGEKGSIVITTPVNFLGKFIYKKDGNEIVIDENDGKHRMYHEFVAFEKMVKEKDYHTANEMMNISMIVMEIIEEAKKQCGLVFDADME